MTKMTSNLRLAFHHELDPLQQQQAARIYVDERNWGSIIKADFNCQGYYPHNLEEMAQLIRQDAAIRDLLFPQNQLVLLGHLLEQEDQWKVLGTIHTTISNKKLVTKSFDHPDTWNFFTHYRQLSPEKYDPQGDRWVCFAIQTDQSLDRNVWKIKPADLIIKGVKVLAFAQKKDYDKLSQEVELSSEVKEACGKYPIQYINPLTRLSGFAEFNILYPEVSAVKYASTLQALQKRSAENKLESDLEEKSKRCSLRYHLSRGAQVEQVIEHFRIHDAASHGYGASVLYGR